MDDSLTKYIQDAIGEKINPDSDDYFVGKLELRKIWQEARSKRSSNGEADLLRNQFITAILENEQDGENCFLITTASILAWIGWTEWAEFHEDFVRDGKPRYPLPLRQQDARSSLGQVGSLFCDVQSHFYSKMIEEGHDMKFSAVERPPFVEDEVPIGEGAYGKVFKVKIVPGYFKGHTQQDSTKVRTSLAARLCSP